MITRHSIIARLSPTDTETIEINSSGSRIAEIRFIQSEKWIDHGVGQMIRNLKDRGLYPTETAIDLCILAATVMAADTRISRQEDSQDSWTREVDLYVPVANPQLWVANTPLLERILCFLTGDVWQLFFRDREEGLSSLIEPEEELVPNAFDSVCLFSGGLDSFIGAIDLLAQGKKPLLVSHYKDTSTAGQEACAGAIGTEYGDLKANHLRANVSFDKNDVSGLGSETSTRGRSFIFFALACLAADTLDGRTPIIIPENGLISLNVPLDPLRLGAWSTRTTHPFYMARWQDLVDQLGINAVFENPYRFKTKGEMLAECRNRELLKDNIALTVSCSSIGKGRWEGRSPGHCGYCLPCLIRRASITSAFGVDPTDYSLSNLSESPLDSSHAESTDIRSFQMMRHRLSQKSHLAKVLVHKTGSLSDYGPDEVEQYESVFRRGIEEVGSLVEGARFEVT